MTESSRRSRRRRRALKDRVLQARIPETLDDALRTRAERLGLSVSSIVRNVLLNTFELVEDVMTDSAEIAAVVQGRDTPQAGASVSPTDAVLGWQEITLNRNGVCEACNAILSTGQRAAVGVPIADRPVLLCADCLAGLSAPGAAESGENAG